MHATTLSGSCCSRSRNRARGRGGRGGVSGAVRALPPRPVLPLDLPLLPVQQGAPAGRHGGAVLRGAPRRARLTARATSLRLALRRRRHAVALPRRARAGGAGLDIARERAIEVLPTHATPEAVAGCTSSASTTSASASSRSTTGCSATSAGSTRQRTTASRWTVVGAFGCVNADLIFDVAFVEPDVFLRDLEACCRSGVEQISTYPLMHFGYTPFGRKEHDPRGSTRCCGARVSWPTGWDTSGARSGRSRGAAPRSTPRSRASSTSAAARARSPSPAPTSSSTTSGSRLRARRSRRAGCRSPAGRGSAHVARRSTTPSGSCMRRASTWRASSGFPRGRVGHAAARDAPSARLPRAAATTAGST